MNESDLFRSDTRFFVLRSWWTAIVAQCRGGGAAAIRVPCNIRATTRSLPAIPLPTGFDRIVATRASRVQLPSAPPNVPVQERFRLALPVLRLASGSLE